jgi:hypothetical protein
MLKRHSAALLEVKTIPNKKYKQADKEPAIKHNKELQN